MSRMAPKSKYFRHTVYPGQGMVDLTQWKPQESSLFLDMADPQSRVEAYPAELLVTVSDPLRLAGGAFDPASADDGGDPLQGAAQLPDKSLDADNFEIPELVTLRSSEDLISYASKTTGFRAFYIRQLFSWSPLLITSSLFSELIRLMHISPQLKRYIIYFGVREREVEVSPPALRFWPLLSSQTCDDGSHECMYGIRFADRNGRGGSDEPSSQWSLRQSAIVCRFCPSDEGATWLFITASQIMQQRLNAYVAENQELNDSDPFKLHILVIDTAISSWRPYLIDLAAETDDHYGQLLGTSPTNKGPVDLHESGRRQKLMVLEEKLSDAVLIVKATVDTVSGLLSAYESVRTCSQTASPSQANLVRASFHDQLRDLQLITAQLEKLRNKLACTTSLLSNFLDLSSGFALQNLARESSKESEEMRKLSERMHELAEKSTRDAAAVKVLTILTLIYLPVTVVSNFFSTSFVNSVTNSDGSGYIIVYGDWWILLAVSIPLTLITLHIWRVWTKIQADNRHPWWCYILGVDYFRRGSNAALSNEKTGYATNSRTFDNGEPILEGYSPPMTHQFALGIY
jgi:Mg2+ and Co2+ transporter CorA